MRSRVQHDIRQLKMEPDGLNEQTGRAARDAPLVDQARSSCTQHCTSVRTWSPGGTVTVCDPVGESDEVLAVTRFMDD